MKMRGGDFIYCCFNDYNSILPQGIDLILSESGINKLSAMSQFHGEPINACKKKVLLVTNTVSFKAYYQLSMYLANIETKNRRKFILK